MVVSIPKGASARGEIHFELKPISPHGIGPELLRTMRERQRAGEKV
jgi:hypothetical protein